MVTLRHSIGNCSSSPFGFSMATELFQISNDVRPISGVRHASGHVVVRYELPRILQATYREFAHPKSGVRSSPPRSKETRDAPRTLPENLTKDRALLGPVETMATGAALIEGLFAPNRIRRAGGHNANHEQRGHCQDKGLHDAGGPGEGAFPGGRLRERCRHGRVKGHISFDLLHRLMSMPVQNRDRSEWLEVRQILSAVRSAPAPFRIDSPERYLREDDDRRATRMPLKVVLKPDQLFSFQLAHPSQYGGVDQAYEVNSFLIEPIPSFTLPTFPKRSRYPLPSSTEMCVRRRAHRRSVSVWNFAVTGPTRRTRRALPNASDRRCEE